MADVLHSSGEKRTVEHKCLAVDPVVLLLVQRTEGLQVLRLVDDPHLALSS